MSTDEDFKTPDEVRQQMMEIRRQMGGHVEGLVDHTHQMLDWKHHVRSHPWISLIASLAAGYAVVPSKSKEEATDDAPTNSPTHASRNGDAKPTNGIANRLASVAGNMLLRAGVAYVGQQAGRVMSQRAAGSAEGEGHDE